MSLKEKLEDLGNKVQKRRDKGENWGDIAAALEVHQGKAMLAFEVVNVTPRERIKGATDKELAKEIVRVRDKENISWGVIAARADIPESRVRKLYESVKGEGATSGNRIGKGGRYPGGGGGSAKKAKPVKKTPAKKATGAKKAGAAKGAKKVSAKKVPLTDMNEDQISARLTGKVIGVDMDGKVKSMKVGKIVGLSEPGGQLTFTDAKDNEHTIGVEDIARAAA